MLPEAYRKTRLRLAIIGIALLVLAEGMRHRRSTSEHDPRIGLVSESEAGDQMGVSIFGAWRSLAALFMSSHPSPAFNFGFTKPVRAFHAPTRVGMPRMSSSMTYEPLVGQSLPRVSDGKEIDLGKELAAPGMTLCILGTYPADFNMIEYLQRLIAYLPDLKAQGVSKFLVTVNGSPSAAKLLGELLDLPSDVELVTDETGAAGRAFGVGRGWLPETDKVNLGDTEIPISPYAKLFGMLLGLGARDTLPSVITGYLGNPSGTNKWIVSALEQGQRAGRWPNMALELDDSGRTAVNKFDELPIVGSWGRRPLELATLRLQTMLGISLARWDDLQPSDERCLTQLGGMIILKDGKPVYEWKDNGICNVADFEEVMKALGSSKAPTAA